MHMNVDGTSGQSAVGRVGAEQPVQEQQKLKPSDQLNSRDTAAAQLKNKLESFRAGASEFLKNAKGPLAIGSGAALIGAGVVGAILLSPIALPGSILGAGIGAALAKSDTLKEAFGKNNLVKAGVTIGSCLCFGVGLLGGKLIEYGVSKIKDNKEKQSLKNESTKMKDQAKNKPKVLTLDQKLSEVRQSKHEANSGEYEGSIQDKINSRSRFVDNSQNAIDSETENINYGNQEVERIGEKYKNDGGIFQGYLGNYMKTPDNKKEDYLRTLNDSAVIDRKNGQGFETMDRVKTDLRNVNVHLKSIAGSKNERDKHIENRDNAEGEIKELKNKLDASNKAFDQEIQTLEKEANEKLLAEQQAQSQSNHKSLS